MPAHPRRKAFGQHFLKDTALCERLTDLCVEWLAKTDCQSLLEVGPGSGALTDPMIRKLATSDTLKRSIRFFTCEKDRKWAAHWSSVVQVHDKDFLELPEKEWLVQPPLGVLSNLPYSAGTAIVLRLAEHPEKIPFMILMFQAEVAQRLRAEPGSKAWGSLSLWIQTQWEISKVASVPPGAFQPPPDVDSEVVLLKPRSKPRLKALTRRDSASFEIWDQLLRACFAHRRKMLRAGLKGAPRFLKALEKSGIDPTLRAEALSWEQWDTLLDSALNSG
ncbi:MAG: ribosomal RNA small subunit methyltransferase A [Betaproteobacteria bacterium]|nr:ribosomal RNA small subunit methyltransferase A [Betaproteobacteria bacterium]